MIRSQYGDKIIKKLRKKKKKDYRLRKTELDLESLVRCRESDMITRCLKFPLANKSLGFSLAYLQCQLN